MKWARRTGLVAMVLASVGLGAPSCAIVAGLSDLELVDSLGGAGGHGTGGHGGSTGTLELGDACVQDGQCASGHCADEVCCDAACDGVCVACVEQSSHLPTGNCGPIPAGEDPDSECSQAACGGSGTCAPALGWLNVMASAGCEDGGFVAARASSNGGGDEVIVGYGHPEEVEITSGCPTVSSTGTLDAAWTRFAGNGDCSDTRTFAEAGTETVTAMTATPDLVAICGRFDQTMDFGNITPPLAATGTADIWVAVLGPGGLMDASWTAAVSSTNGGGRCRAIAIDPANGGVVVVGNVGPAPEVNGGGVFSSDPDGGPFVARFAENGVFEWGTVLGGDVTGRAFAVDIVGNWVLVAGQLSPTDQTQVDLGDGVWHDLYGDNDAFLAVLDSNNGGTMLESRVYGGPGVDGIYALAHDEADNALICGSFANDALIAAEPINTVGTAVVVAKLGITGDVQWLKTFGGPEDVDGDRCRGMIVRGDEVTVAGHFEGSIDFGGGPLVAASAQDIFLARLSASDGSHRWSARFGEDTTAYDFRSLQLQLDNAGDIVLAGELAGTIDFGSGPVSSIDNGACPNGDTDIFVTKFLLPEGG